MAKKPSVKSKTEKTAKAKPIAKVKSIVAAKPAAKASPVTKAEAKTKKTEPVAKTVVVAKPVEPKATKVAAKPETLKSSKSNKSDIAIPAATEKQTPDTLKAKPAEAPKKAKKEGRAKKEKVNPLLTEDLTKIDRSTLNEEQLKWFDLYRKNHKLVPIKYNIREQFTANQPIDHSLFGWGWILSSEYDRLEVIFKEGKKMLISNRK